VENRRNEKKAGGISLSRTAEAISLCVAFHAHGNGEASQPTGYHGEVTIDADSGTILSLTVQADLPFGSPVLRGDIEVEYESVEIGGKTYTCPVRSVSISLDAEGLGGLGPYNAFNHLPQIPYAFLNDVTFGEYHLFRSNSRMLTGNVPVPEH
jgi:hypothetical protein